MPQDDSHQQPPVLSAQLADVTSLANLLRCVAFQTHAVVTASEHGLEIVTELNRSLQAHAYLYSQMFDQYHFAPPTRTKRGQRHSRPAEDGGESPDSEGLDQEEEPPSVSFEVNLQTWISCLNIFGGAGTSRQGQGSSANSRPSGSGYMGAGQGSYRRGGSTVPQMASSDRPGDEGEDEMNSGSGPFGTSKATRMKLSYQGIGHALVLELEQEANVVTRCAISTYEASFLTDMAFDASQMVSQVIMPSELLHSALSEVDQSCKRLSVSILPQATPTGQGQRSGARAGLLRFTAPSDVGSSEMEFPATTSSSNPNGVMEKFVALAESSEQWYSFGLISKTLASLRSSIKTSIRIDNAGLISFQFMMPRRQVPVAGESRAVLTEQDYAFVEFMCIPLDESTLVV